MPFWKQSEDPWDRKPEKRRPEPREPREPMENPLDTIKAWNEDRKARAKEKEEAKWLPPEKCPWCGKDMEQGYMIGGRDAPHWHPGIYKYEFLRSLDSRGLDLLDEGGIWSGLYKTVWACRDCKKMVFTMPDPPEAYEPLSARPEAEETQEEEESGE